MSGFETNVRSLVETPTADVMIKYESNTLTVQISVNGWDIETWTAGGNRALSLIEHFIKCGPPTEMKPTEFSVLQTYTEEDDTKEKSEEAA